MMFPRFRTMALTASFAALGTLASGTAARANIISDFTGTCSAQCTGTATGVLTLTDAYVPGTDMTTADFVSFSFMSSDLSFTISNAPGIFLAGGLNADGSFDAAGQLIVQPSTGTPLFESLPGEWVAARPGGNASNSDVGFSFTFSPLSTTAVPEPASLVLLGTGILALGLLRRKTAST